MGRTTAVKAPALAVSDGSAGDAERVPGTNFAIIENVLHCLVR